MKPQDVLFNQETLLLYTVVLNHDAGHLIFIKDIG